MPKPAQQPAQPQPQSQQPAGVPGVPSAGALHRAVLAASAVPTAAAAAAAEKQQRREGTGSSGAAVGSAAQPQPQPQPQPLLSEAHERIRVAFQRSLGGPGFVAAMGAAKAAESAAAKGAAAPPL